MIKKRKKALTILTVIVVVVTLLYAGLAYLRLYGFKRALIELVHSKTNGQYELTIGRSFIEATSLTFAFDSLAIERNPTFPKKGIKSVHVPQLKIRLASLFTIFRSKQFDIQMLTIDEPTIEIDSPPKQPNEHKNIHLTQQIVKLYPAIESLLERFNIEYFYIKRASIGIRESSNLTLKLKLMDLLIEQWNIKKLEANRQLQITIAEQQLNFGKAKFNFSGIEYNFRKRQLRFSDFNYSSLDTISQSRVNISGKFLLMEKLDYTKLIDEQKLTYEKVLLENPEIDLQLKLGKTKSTGNAKTDEKEVITRILKQAIGECSIDSTIIHNGTVHAILEHGQDQIMIDLPRLNFKLHTFKVTHDSSTFQLGEGEIEIDKSRVKLSTGLQASCDKIFFDTLRNLTVKNLEVYDSIKKEKIASCGLVKLHSFRPLDFIFYKELVIHSVRIEDADIHLTPESHASQTKKNNTAGLKALSIDDLELKNISIHYSGNNNVFSVAGLSIKANNLKQKSAKEYQYAISRILVNNASVKLGARNLNVSLRSVDFDGRTIQVGAINLHKDSLTIGIKKFTAANKVAMVDLKIDKYMNWQSIQANTLKVIGKLPSLEKNKSDTTKKSLSEFSIDEVGIQNLIVVLHNDKMNVAVTGNTISVADFSSSVSGEIKHGLLTGNLSNIKFNSASLTASVNNIDIRYPDRILLNNINLTKDNLNISVPSFSIQSIEQKEKTWNVKKVGASTIAVKLDGNPLFNADSLLLTNTHFTLHDIPSTNNIEVYNPNITLHEKHGKLIARKSEKPIDLSPLGHFIIHPGILHLPNQEALTFGRIEGDAKERELMIAYLNTETKKMAIELNNIHLKQNQLAIDSLLLIPNEEYYSKSRKQEGKIKASIYGVAINGFSIDSVLKSKTLKNVDVTIDRFSMNVSKDKRLPDSAFVEKSATLAGMLKLPKQISLKRINVKQGNIHVSEISAKTGQEGVLTLNDISALLELDYTKSTTPFVTMKAKAKLYNDGIINLNYETVDSASFILDADVSNFDLPKLNRMVTPLQAIEIKSGYLNHYQLHVLANNDEAIGTATITYKDLHLVILKRDDPEKKNLGSELLTLLADGVILRHNKTNATSKVKQVRTKHKSTFNYWIMAAVHGAMGTIRNGKNQKETTTSVAAGK